MSDIRSLSYGSSESADSCAVDGWPGVTVENEGAGSTVVEGGFLIVVTCSTSGFAETKSS